MPLRVVIYPRLSSVKKSGGAEQEQSDSIENQITALTALVEHEGHELVRDGLHYADDGKSGFKGIERPGFSMLMGDLGKNLFDRVLVRHDDRLFRNDAEASMFRVACARYGITWQTVSGAVTDPGTAQGSLLATMTAGIAQYESQVKRERLLMKYAQMRAEGDLLPQGFGWDRGGNKNAEQAEHVQWMFEHLAAGGSVGAIVRRMNDEQVPQLRGGKKWQHGTVVSILRNPRVAGLVPDGSGGVLTGVKGNWDQLVTPTLFEAAQVAWRAKQTTAGPRNNFSTKHLLGGIALCGRCGFVLRSNGAADNRGGQASTGTYRCDRNRHLSEKDGLRHVSARVDELDEQVRRAVVDAFTFGTGNLLPQMDEDVRRDLAVVHHDLLQLGQQRADLLASLHDPDLGLTLADIKPGLRALAEQVERREAARQQLQQRSAAASMLTDLRDDVLRAGQPVPFEDVIKVKRALRARLDAMHIERQRELVRHFLEVTVMPGRGAKKHVIEHKIVTSLNEDDEQDFLA